MNEKYFILKRINPIEEQCEILEDKYFDTYNEVFGFYQISKKKHKELYIRKTKEGKANIIEPLPDYWG